MEPNGVPSSSGFRTLEAACSSPPPHAPQAPPSCYSAARDPPPILSSVPPLAATGSRLQPAAAAAAMLPKSGRPIEANGVCSSSGFRSSESACSSPPPDALQEPPSSSAAALEPPPLQSSMPLAEPSASASREGSEQPDLKIEVYFLIGAGMETIKAAFHSSQTVDDIKEFFEKKKGKGVCPAENMVIYHDGTKLSNMTKLGTLDLKKWNSIVITSEENISLPTTGSLSPIQEVMVDEGFTLPFDFFHSESTNEDDLPLSFQEDAEHTVNCHDYTAPNDHDYLSILGQSAYIAESPTDIAETAPNDAETLPAIACVTPRRMPGHQGDISGSSATNETALPTIETAPAVAETSLIQADEPLPIDPMNLVTSSCSHILVGRVLIPATPADFVDQLLSNSDIHGFNTVNEVLSDINTGPPGWVRKSQALALLYNGEIFSIDAEVQEGDKRDGLIWVINSTKSHISKTIKGCKAAANEESSEHFIRTMKENGVEIDWFEVRGKLWTRRRLALTASDGVFQLLQWKQHKKRETDVGPATTSGEREQLARGLAENSPGGPTGFEEMRNLIQGVQATVSAQLKEFEMTVSTRLSQFESHIQSIDTRLQAIEQERAR